MNSSAAQLLRESTHSAHRWVLVDFFDTIVRRTVHPEYVKYIWAERIRQSCGLELSSMMIYQLRNEIEAQICRNNASSGKDEEFHYGQFCRVFYDRLFAHDRLKISASEFASRSSQIELSIEKSVQEVDLQLVAQLEVLSKQGAKIILVSDFYLSEEQFLDLLKHHHLSAFFDSIYISSEFLETKRSGKLYDRIIQAEGIDPAQAFMIGDNPYSDVDRAKERGIDATLIDRTKRREHYEQLKARAASREEIDSDLELFMEQELSGDVLFPEMVASLFLFCAKLFHRLTKEGVKNIFFLSREGEVLKRFFDHYQGQFAGGEVIKTHYLIASRCSTFLPSLKKLDEEDFEMLFRNYPDLSAREFLLHFAMDEGQIAGIASSLGVDASQRIDDFPESEIFRAITELNEFKEHYEQARLEQADLLKRYIESFGADLKKEGLHLVDIGWRGTMQDNLHRLFSGICPIHGYYLGLTAAVNVGFDNLKEGLLFSPNAYFDPSFWVYSESTSLYEILLAASHGSADGYLLEDGKAKPKLGDCSFERDFYVSKLRPMLLEYESRFLRFCNFFQRTHFSPEDFTPNFARVHGRMVFQPTGKELEFFQSAKHFENFGLFQFTVFAPVKSLSLRERFRNLRALIRNPREALGHSLWPIAMFDQLGLGALRRIYGFSKQRKLVGARPGLLSRISGKLIEKVYRSAKRILLPKGA